MFFNFVVRNEEENISWNDRKTKRWAKHTRFFVFFGRVRLFVRLISLTFRIWVYYFLMVRIKSVLTQRLWKWWKRQYLKDEKNVWCLESVVTNLFQNSNAMMHKYCCFPVFMRPKRRDERNKPFGRWVKLVNFCSFQERK